jgi:hypothetical protein
MPPLTRTFTKLCLLFEIIHKKMRAHAALLLLSVAASSALRMNYKSEANRDLLITLLPVLAIRDVQYPLTEAKADFDTIGPGGAAIWEDAGLTKQAFFFFFVKDLGTCKQRKTKGLQPYVSVTNAAPLAAQRKLYPLDGTPLLPLRHRGTWSPWTP